MTDQRKNREDPRYPAIKIYALASLLADVTTDHARPFLQEVGFLPHQIDVLNMVVRPTIQIYGNDFYGIVSSELAKLQNSLLRRLRETEGNVEEFFRLLQMLSEGRRRFLYVPLCAQIDIDLYLQQRKQVFFTVDDAFERFLYAYRETISKPREQLRQRYAAADRAWKDGLRTSWDETVYKLIFESLGSTPDIVSCFGHLSLRTLAKSVVQHFSEPERLRIHEELTAIFSQPGSARIGFSNASDVLSFDEILRQSEEEWQELHTDLAADSK